MRRLISLAMLATAAAAFTALPAHATTAAVPCIVNKDHAQVRWAGGQYYTTTYKGRTFYVNDPTGTGWRMGSFDHPTGGSLDEMKREDLDCPGD
jgi:hypothetical protein